MITWTASNPAGMRLMSGEWRRWYVLISFGYGNSSLRITQGSRVVLARSLPASVSVGQIQRMATQVIFAHNIIEEFAV